MKKKFILLAAIITIISLSLFTACGNEDPNVPKDHSTTINLFGNTRTAIVKGYMTGNEWEGVADKIKNNLNTYFNINTGAQAGYNEVFSRGVFYIVEVNPNGYTNIKTIGDGKTIYIALSAIDTTYVTSAVGAIYLNGTTTANICVKLPSIFLS